MGEKNVWVEVKMLKKYQIKFNLNNINLQKTQRIDYDSKQNIDIIFNIDVFLASLPMVEMGRTFGYEWVIGVGGKL